MTNTTKVGGAVPCAPKTKSLAQGGSCRLSLLERFCAGAALLLALAFLLAFAACLSGCVNPNTGTSTIIGEQLALPEISDATDNISVRVYESIKGARVWTAKDSVVSVEYANAYTNCYFGIVETRDTMKLKVKVEPCEVDETTTQPTNQPTTASNQTEVIQ